MIKKKKFWVLLNAVLLVSFMFIATTKAEAQPDFMRGFGALKGLVEQVQKSIPANGAAQTPTATGSAVNGGARTATEFCESIKANPLVQEYLPVLRKAVQTKVTAYDKEMRNAVGMRFDTPDGQLREWVETMPSPTGEPNKTSYSNFGRYVVSWASLCAARNNDNDLFLFFLSDLRDSDAIAKLRGKAKDAIKVYGATTVATKLDANGQPIQLTTRSEEKLKFDLGYEDSSFGLESPLWVTLSAFMLPNGTTAMQSTGKGKATVLMAQIDQAVAANDIRKVQVEAENKQREKTEADTAAKQAKILAVKEVEKNTPNALLQQAYQAIQLVQTCSDVRKGYATIYISDVELNDAKEKMRKIESALKPKIVGETTDQIWNRASTENANYIRGVKTATYTNGRNYCDLFKRDMTGVSEKVLGKEVPQKTF